MTQSEPVAVIILDKEYLVSCGEHEREQLYATVEYINDKMLDLKNSGKVIGTERIAVMAALNIANELLAYKQEKKDYTSSVDTTVKRLYTKINDAVIQENQTKTSGR